MVSDHDIDLNLTGFARLHLPWRGLFRVLSRSAVHWLAILNAVGLPFAWVGLMAVVERDHARRSARRRREGKVGLTVSLKKSRAANS
jgi:hypothetical protein